MKRLLTALTLTLSACGTIPPLEPAPTNVGGISALVSSRYHRYRPGESIDFDFEVRNAGTAAIRFVPVHCWDRVYPWHASRFDEAEGALIVERLDTPGTGTRTSASG